MLNQHSATNPAATLTATIQAAIQAALPRSHENTQPAAIVAQVPAPVLYTVNGMVEAEPALTVGGLRDDLLHRRTNGLAESGAVIRRGRLLLLHREKYLAWLLARGEEKN